MIQKPPEYFKFCPEESLLVKQKQTQRTFLCMPSEIIYRSIIPFTWVLIPVNLESLQRTLTHHYNVNFLYIYDGCIDFRSHQSPPAFFFFQRENVFLRILEQSSEIQRLMAKFFCARVVFNVGTIFIHNRCGQNHKLENQV